MRVTQLSRAGCGARCIVGLGNELGMVCDVWGVMLVERCVPTGSRAPCFDPQVFCVWVSLGPGGAAAVGAARAQDRGESPGVCGELPLGLASLSPASSFLMERQAASFSTSRSCDVTLRPGSGAGGSTRGSPRLGRRRGILRLRGFELSHGNAQLCKILSCPEDTRELSVHGVRLDMSPAAEVPGSRASSFGLCLDPRRSGE